MWSHAIKIEYDLLRYRNSDENKLRILHKRMQSKFPIILKELDRDGVKNGHWAWWVFPTEKKGANEPPPETSVDNETEALFLLEHMNENTLNEWIRILRIRMIVPSIDDGRIKAFKKQWSGYKIVEHKYKKLYSAIDNFAYKVRGTIDSKTNHAQPKSGHVVLMDPLGHILVLRGKKNNKWQLPGGMREQGESVEDAAKREFKEETGYDLEKVFRAKREKQRGAVVLYYTDVRLWDKLSKEKKYKDGMFDLNTTEHNKIGVFEKRGVGWNAWGLKRYHTKKWKPLPLKDARGRFLEGIRSVGL